jgi:hypothetical protein
VDRRHGCCWPACRKRRWMPQSTPSPRCSRA